MKKLKILLGAALALAFSALGAGAATTRYAEIRQTLQPDTTNYGVFLGSATVNILNTTTFTATTIVVSTLTASTRFVAPTGSLSLPSYTFSGRLTDGMFSSGSNSLSLVTNAVARMRVINSGLDILSGDLAFSGSGVILASSGTATAPGVTFPGDTNTGFYRDGADSAAIAAGGAAAALFSTTGLNFYIGGSEDFNLRTQGWRGPSGTAALPGYAFKGDPDTGVSNPSANVMVWSVAGATVAIANTSGVAVTGSLSANNGVSANVVTATGAIAATGQLSTTGGLSVATNTTSAAAFTVQGTSVVARLPVYLTGTTTNDNAPSGFNGEYVSSKTVSGAAGTASTGSAQWFDIISTATTSGGDFDIDGIVCGTVNGATVTDFRAAITSTAGNATTGQIDGDNTVYTPSVPTATADSCIALPSIRATITTGTTYYLKCRLTFSVATPKGYGRISIRRAR